MPSTRKTRLNSTFKLCRPEFGPMCRRLNMLIQLLDFICSKKCGFVGQLQTIRTIFIGYLWSSRTFCLDFCHSNGVHWACGRCEWNEWNAIVLNNDNCSGRSSNKDMHTLTFNWKRHASTFQCRAHTWIHDHRSRALSLLTSLQDYCTRKPSEQQEQPKSLVHHSFGMHFAWIFKSVFTTFPLLMNIVRAAKHVP